MTVYCWPEASVNWTGVKPVATVWPFCARTVHIPVSAWPELYWLLTVRGYEELLWCVKVAVALAAEPVDARTVLVPGAEEGGTANEAVKAPELLVMTEVGVVATALPL